LHYVIISNRDMLQTLRLFQGYPKKEMHTVQISLRNTWFTWALLEWSVLCHVTF
jgi:hypothetical protein